MYDRICMTPSHDSICKAQLALSDLRTRKNKIIQSPVSFPWPQNSVTETMLDRQAGDVVLQHRRCCFISHCQANIWDLHGNRPSRSLSKRYLTYTCLLCLHTVHCKTQLCVTWLVLWSRQDSIRVTLFACYVFRTWYTWQKIAGPQGNYDGLMR